MPLPPEPPPAPPLSPGGTTRHVTEFTIAVRQDDAPTPAALKQAVRALLWDGVQLRQITVTITNSSYSLPAAGRRLGTGRRLGVTNTSNATSSSVWAVSVRVAFEGVDEAREATKQLQAAITDPAAATAN